MVPFLMPRLHVAVKINKAGTAFVVWAFKPLLSLEAVESLFFLLLFTKKSEQCMGKRASHCRLHEIRGGHMKRISSVFLASLCMVLVVGSAAVAAETPASTGGYAEGVIRVLGNLLVLSVVFEVAYNVLFDWRWFLARYDGKGVKRPLVLIGALCFTFGVDIDFMQKLLAVMDYLPETYGTTIPGKVITAMLLTGGSSGVLEIFSKLGIRNQEEAKKKAERARRELTESQQAQV